MLLFRVKSGRHEVQILAVWHKLQFSILHDTHVLLYKVEEDGHIHVPVGDTIKPDWQTEQ
jgi:hypothetical protein